MNRFYSKDQAQQKKDYQIQYFIQAKKKKNQILILDSSKFKKKNSISTNQKIEMENLAFQKRSISISKWSIRFNNRYPFIRVIFSYFQKRQNIQI